MSGTHDLKSGIKDAIEKCASGDLSANALHLLKTLGYHSDLRAPLRKRTYAEFDDLYVRGNERFNAKNALTTQWQSIDLLFQLTADQLNKQDSLFKNEKIDRTEINSYLFFVLELKTKGNGYTRTELSHITREVNKLFAMPAMLLFKQGDTITLAVIDRRLHKRDNSKDVLEKVTLIRDIRTAEPHRAHIEILHDLSVDVLRRKHDFKNFPELHAAWRKTLDVTELNRSFFKELSNWYFHAVRATEWPADAVADPAERNSISVIRMITRLMFVWFLREKGLVPDELFEKRKLDKLLRWGKNEDSTYYKAILQNLFFATLNTAMDSREFRSEGSKPSRKGHFGITSLFRYRDRFVDPDETLEKVFEKIPFLNGGLFECLDPEPEKGIKRTLVDGFSEMKGNPLRVPDSLFFNEAGTEVDLTDVVDPGRRYVVKIKGLINILDSYKFTIAENTPIEEEVALDPELLGKVFENLLASYNPETEISARKQTGSFYTPREIVNYMVDESLINYLHDCLGKQVEDLPRLRKLVSYTDAEALFVDEPETREKLIKAIDNLKVLDPACGSGAFPMGVLHKLVHVLHKLDRDNAGWKQRQLDRVDRLIAEAEVSAMDSGVDEKLVSDLEETRRDIEETFGANELDYGRKLYLIENGIYGVDIQPIAMQIAKLRFFISLIVDQKVDRKRPNLGVRPLPNLETKFAAANTLVALESLTSGQVALGVNEDVIKRIRKDLRDVRHRHFLAKTQRTKAKCRTQDKALRAELRDELKNGLLAPEDANVMAAWDPYDQNKHADFFDPGWMFNVADGFDLVIGNPPYMRVQNLQRTQAEMVPYYKEHYSSATGNFDLYAVFVERGVQLLHTTGQLVYILPHKFFQAGFGVGLRKLLTKRSMLREVVRFGTVQVFEEATTYTCLLFLHAQPQKTFGFTEVKQLKEGDDVLDALRDRVEHPNYVSGILPVPTDDKWEFALGESNKVLARIKQHKTTLGDITRKIFVGLQSSADDIYVLRVLASKGPSITAYSKALDAEVEIEEGFVKPFLLGKDIHRYEPAVPKHVVIFPYTNVEGKAKLMNQTEIKTKFPKGWKYLMQNKQALGDRERGLMHGERFYAYVYPKNLVEFTAQKVMTPDICGRGEMTYDHTGLMYFKNTMYGFVFNDEAQKPDKYHLGILNSKMLWYFLTITGNRQRGDYIRFNTKYLQPFPIAEPDKGSNLPEQVETLVDYTLYLKASTPQEKRDPSFALMIAYYEQLIDALAYELYFPEEFPAGKQLSKLLVDDALLPLAKMKGDKVKVLQAQFEKLYHKEHSVRRHMFFLDTIEAVKVIEAAAR